MIIMNVKNSSVKSVNFSTEKSPEQIFASFLNGLSDADFLWSNVERAFTKQFCFQTWSCKELQDDKEKARLWFNTLSKDTKNFINQE